MDVVVGDTMGELQKLYAAADVAFVGGSLVEVGGHNILEACAVGIPVIFGPHMFQAEEISAMALERGAACRIQGVVRAWLMRSGLMSSGPSIAGPPVKLHVRWWRTIAARWSEHWSGSSARWQSEGRLRRVDRHVLGEPGCLLPSVTDAGLVLS